MDPQHSQYPQYPQYPKNLYLVPMGLLALLWIGYYGIHSLLAASTVKAYVNRHFPSMVPYYRLCYNVLAVSLFLLIYAYQQQLPSTAGIWEEQVGIRWLGLLLIATGGGLGIWAFRPYNLQEFIGTQQLERDFDASPLVTKGLHAYVRHPLYFAGIWVLLGLGLYADQYATWIFVAISILYIWIGTFAEEKKLLLEFGDTYKTYQEQVKRLIPFIY